MSNTHINLFADLDQFSREFDSEWDRTVDEISVLITNTHNSIADKLNGFKEELKRNLDKHRECVEKNNNDIGGLLDKVESVGRVYVTFLYKVCAYS